MNETESVIGVRLPGHAFDGPGALWMVASRSVEGAFWPVTYSFVGDRSRGYWEWDCACPWGRSQREVDRAERVACRHLKAVAAFENVRLARPVSPVNVSALID